MAKDLESVSAGRFAHSAETDPSLWGFVEGCAVKHRVLGIGNIVRIDRSEKSVPYILVRFEQNEGERVFNPSAFRDGYFETIDIPARIQEALLSLEEDRKREEEARAEYLILKRKFEISPSYDSPEGLDPLYAILKKMDRGDEFSQDDVAFLEEKALWGLLARYYSDLFRLTGEPWKVVQQCRCLRKAERPDEVLSITEALLDRGDLDATLRAALLTTRGGAYRDKELLVEAQECAMRAIKEDDKSYRPLNLLGAVYLQTGEPDKAMEVFERARALGSGDQKAEIRQALDLAGSEHARKSAAYFLSVDPVRYSWVRRYLR